MSREPETPIHAAPDRPGVAIRPPLLFLAGIALGWAAETAWPSTFGLGRAGWALAGLLGIGGAALLGAAVMRFRRAGTHIQTHHPALALVESGPYRFSRNPIYVGLILLHAAIAIGADSLWIALALVPVAAVLRVGVVAREERYLEAKFGDAYRAYRARVRRWL